MTDATAIDAVALKRESDRAIEYALDQLRAIPRSTRGELEAHLTSVLIVFWGALHGTFGTEFATGFIEAQLNGMKHGTAETYVPAAPN